MVPPDVIFKVKMHQSRFRVERRPRHRWGSSQHSPDLQLDLVGPAVNGREGKGRREKEEKEKERKETKGRNTKREKKRKGRKGKEGRERRRKKECSIVVKCCATVAVDLLWTFCKAFSTAWCTTYPQQIEGSGGRA